MAGVYARGDGASSGLEKLSPALACHSEARTPHAGGRSPKNLCVRQRLWPPVAVGVEDRIIGDARDAEAGEVEEVDFVVAIGVGVEDEVLAVG